MRFRRPAWAYFVAPLVLAVAAAAWAVASPAGIGCAFAAEASLISPVPNESQGFVAAINRLRASKGLAALSVDGNLSDLAQSWANEMAVAGGISHRPDLSSGVTGNWQTLGENVGVGASVDSLMDAFIASPGHYKNLVEPRYTHVGVGTVRVGGIIYTAHEFMAARGGAVATPPPPVATVAVTAAPRVRAVAAPKPAVTAAPTTTPAPTPTPTPATTLAPIPTTLPVVVEPLPADQQLERRGGNNQQEKKRESDGRCRPHVPDLQVLVK